jgi:hypothetical protein
MSTIAETLSPFRDQVSGGGVLDWDAMASRLQEREDQMREDLSLIAARLGTFPELVAEAFVEVGLGTPPTPEVREMLHRQFHERLEWLQEQYRQHGGG